MFKFLKRREMNDAEKKLYEERQQIADLLNAVLRVGDDIPPQKTSEWQVYPRLDNAYEFSIFYEYTTRH